MDKKSKLLTLSSSWVNALKDNPGGRSSGAKVLLLHKHSPRNTWQGQACRVSARGREHEIRPGQEMASRAQSRVQCMAEGAWEKSRSETSSRIHCPTREACMLCKVWVGSGKLGPGTKREGKPFLHRSSHEAGKQRMGDKRHIVLKQWTLTSSLAPPQHSPQLGKTSKDHHLKKASQEPHQKNQVKDSWRTPPSSPAIWGAKWVLQTLLQDHVCRRLDYWGEKGK